MGKVIPIGMHIDVPVDDVLASAVGKLEGVVLLGYDHEGNEMFFSSYADGGTVIWLLESCKKQLLESVEVE